MCAIQIHTCTQYTYAVCSTYTHIRNEYLLCAIHIGTYTRGAQYRYTHYTHCVLYTDTIHTTCKIGHTLYKTHYTQCTHYIHYINNNTHCSQHTAHTIHSNSQYIQFTLYTIHTLCATHTEHTHKLFSVSAQYSISTIFYTQYPQILTPIPTTHIIHNTDPNTHYILYTIPTNNTLGINKPRTKKRVIVYVHIISIFVCLGKLCVHCVYFKGL